MRYFTTRVRSIYSQLTHLTATAYGFPATAIGLAVPEPLAVSNAVITFDEDVDILAVHLSSSFYASGVSNEILAVHVGIRSADSTVAINNATNLLISHVELIQGNVNGASPRSSHNSHMTFGTDSSVRMLAQQKISFLWTYGALANNWVMDAIAQVYFLPVAGRTLPGNYPP